MTPNPDTLCPECHGAYDLLLVRAERLVKRCRDCGHRWNEARESTTAPMFRGNYVNPYFFEGVST